MAIEESYGSGREKGVKTVPFESVEEAWFWFIQAQEARNQGARFVNGLGKMPRPCEPVDILKVLDRLYRQRRLLRHHLLVLRHYGRRSLAPDQKRVKEARAWDIWKEALERLEPPLVRKGIVQIAVPVPNPNWHQDFKLYEGGTVQ